MSIEMDIANAAACTFFQRLQRAARSGMSEAMSGTSEPVPVRVLAAVIRRGDRFLLCQRPAHKRHGGLWEFPGGKLEPGESLSDAARREMLEELDVRASSVGETLYVCADPGSAFVIEFTAIEIENDPRPVEHDDMRWVTMSEVVSMRLAPADAAFVKWLER